MHSFVPLAGTQCMVGGFGLLLTVYLRCTAVIVNSLLVQPKLLVANDSFGNR